MKSGGFHEIRRISGEIHPNLINSDVSAKTLQFGGGCMEGAMTPDFMKSKVIVPLLHSSCGFHEIRRISCEIERPLARNCNPMFIKLIRRSDHPSLCFPECKIGQNPMRIDELNVKNNFLPLILDRILI